MTERGRVRVEHGQKSVRALVGGHVVADTEHPLLVWESPFYPAYYFPAVDVVATLQPTGALDHSPSRGDAVVCDVAVAGGTVKAAARRYGDDSPIEALRGTVALDWNAMDEWLEEDEPIYTRPAVPRIDVLASSRHVRVVVDGVTVAESDQPRILFETGAPPRFYLPMAHLRLDLLAPSATETHCPYKGSATYWHLDVGGERHDDFVWTYRTPLAESQKIAGLACFYNERVDLYLDGELQERPRTHFS